MLGLGALGQITPAGSPEQLSTGYTLIAEAGLYNLTGYDADMVAARVLSAGAGQITITGGEAFIGRHRDFSVDYGQYEITGYDARVYQSSFFGDAEMLRVTPDVTSMAIAPEPRRMVVYAELEPVASVDDQDDSIEPRLRRT